MSPTTQACCTPPPCEAATQFSRRNCLSLATAALAAPLLQACGGGGGSGFGVVAPILPPIPGPIEAESVRWCRDTIHSTLARPGIQTSAVTVALLVDDRVVWREAFGHVNRETGQLATPDTPFNIGSVAKIVTAVAAMILRDRGLLALDQPLVELLPSFTMRSPEHTQVTVRHLLSHASGFPGTNERNTLNFAPVLDYAEDTLKGLALSRLKHEPGELAVYCNDGFTLIELLVQQLTGQRFTDFVQREIFDPLGMTRSSYATEPAAEGEFIHPYRDGVRLPQEMAAVFGTGGTISTASDMLLFARMLIDGGVFAGRRIVSADGIREMGLDQDPRVRINLTPGLQKGLGWDSVHQAGLAAAGLHAWGKAGNTEFFAAQFIVLPAQRMAVMISGCGQDYGYLSLAEGLLLRAAQERGALGALPPEIADTQPPRLSPAPDASLLAGVYGNDSLPYQWLAEADGSLTLKRWFFTYWATVLTGLRARVDGHWWKDGDSTRCFRFQQMQGRFYCVERKRADNRLYWFDEPLGERLAPTDVPLPPAWQARLGTRWLCVNDSPDSLASRLHPWAGSIDELDALPGYVMWNNAQLLQVIADDEAGPTIKVPLYSGRDLVTLRIVVPAVEPGQVTPEEEVHIGVQVYRLTTAAVSSPDPAEG